MLRYIPVFYFLATATPVSAQTFNFDPIGDIAHALGLPAPPTPSLGGARVPNVATPHVRRRVRARTGSAAPAVRAAAAAAGVPADLAVKVAQSESGNRCTAGSRYKGPLQILPATARALGYSGDGSDLNTCGAGLRWGMAHLAMCFRKAGGNPIKTIRCHRGGVGTI